MAPTEVSEPWLDRKLDEVITAAPDPQPGVLVAQPAQYWDPGAELSVGFRHWRREIWKSLQAACDLRPFGRGSMSLAAGPRPTPGSISGILPICSYRRGRSFLATLEG